MCVEQNCLKWKSNYIKQYLNVKRVMEHDGIQRFRNIVKSKEQTTLFMFYICILTMVYVVSQTHSSGHHNFIIIIII